MTPPPFRVAEYDPRWPSMYEEARAEILGCCAPLIKAVEHVGSTAVPGLAAKPTIDIMAGVESLDGAASLVAPLASIGFEYVPKDGQPERLCFRRGPRGAGTHHLHVVELGGREWRRHLAFRDRLRADAGKAREYERLKRELAAAHAGDRGAYTEAKSPFIAAVVDEATRRGEPARRLDEGE